MTLMAAAAKQNAPSPEKRIRLLCFGRVGIDEFPSLGGGLW